MYLHLNKNCVIKNKSIIGIFSIGNINKTKEFEKLCENIEIINLSDNNPKSFILTSDNGKIKGYILKLNVNTIKNRIIDVKYVK